MGKTVKKCGKWERKLYQQAQNATLSGNRDEQGSEWRAYDHEGRRLYLNIKNYSGYEPAALAALAKRWNISDERAEEISAELHERAQEQFIESADECARYVLLGDESGMLDLNTREWDEKSKLRIGGRSGGWMSAEWGPMMDPEHKWTREERRKLIKFARQAGSSADYFLSAEYLIEETEANPDAFDLEDPAGVAAETERRDWAERAPVSGETA